MKDEIIKKDHEINRLKNRIKELEKSEAERQQAEERIKHLNRVLRAIRKVNQLIIREINRDALIQKTCKILIETRGYYNAWIVLLDEKGKYLASSRTGFGKDFAPMKKLLEQEKWTECGKRALKQKELIITEDPKKECPDCPLSSAYAGRGAYTVCLVHHDRIYGLLSVSIPIEFAQNQEEQLLFREIASDISFALHNIRVVQDQKKAEKMLQQNEDELNAIFNGANDGIVLLDKTGKILRINKYIVEIGGYTEEEILGKRFSALKMFPKKSMSKMITVFGKLIKGQEISYEVEAKTKKGEKKIIEVHNSFVKKEGKVKGVIAILRDITKRKKSEEELKKHKNHLEELVKERTAELEKKNKKLKHFNELFVGREFRIKELRDKVKELEKVRKK